MAYETPASSAFERHRAAAIVHFDKAMTSQTLRTRMSELEHGLIQFDFARRHATSTSDLCKTHKNCMTLQWNLFDVKQQLAAAGPANEVPSFEDFFLAVRHGLCCLHDASKGAAMPATWIDEMHAKLAKICNDFVQIIKDANMPKKTRVKLLGALVSLLDGSDYGSIFGGDKSKRRSAVTTLAQVLMLRERALCSMHISVEAREQFDYRTAVPAATTAVQDFALHKTALTAACSQGVAIPLHVANDDEDVDTSIRTEQNYATCGSMLIDATTVMQRGLEESDDLEMQAIYQALALLHQAAFMASNATPQPVLEVEAEACAHQALLYFKVLKIAGTAKDRAMRCMALCDGMEVIINAQGLQARPWYPEVKEIAELVIVVIIPIETPLIVAIRAAGKIGPDEIETDAAKRFIAALPTLGCVSKAPPPTNVAPPTKSTVLALKAIKAAFDVKKAWNIGQADVQDTPWTTICTVICEVCVHLIDEVTMKSGAVAE